MSKLKFLTFNFIIFANVLSIIHLVVYILFEINNYLINLLPVYKIQYIDEVIIFKIRKVMSKKMCFDSLLDFLKVSNEDS